MQSKESFVSGGNLDNGFYHHKNKLGEVEARNVQSRMSDLYKLDFKKYLREARKMYDESELSDEAIFNIWKKQNLDKYPHPKKTIDVNYDEIITQDLPKTKEVNVLENLQKLKPETIDELREEWVMMTNAERGGYAKDELEKAMREKATVFENDLALKSIITQDLNAQNGVSYGVDKDKLKNLGIMSQKQQGKSMDLSEFLDENGAVDYQKLENLAVNLPSKLSYKGFLRQFKDTNKVIINTPIKDLEVNPKYMFFHLTKYGDKQSRIKGNGKENRLWLNGGVLETLQKPLFVTQDTSGTIYFYKAFKNNKGLINLVSVAVPKNNSQMIYKTSYDGTNKRILDLIKNHKLIYKAS